MPLIFLSKAQKCLLRLTSIMLMLFTIQSHGAVILQYHHVSDTTPDSTSISPAQFAKHIQYLADEGYRVVPLSTIVEALKNKQPLSDKTVAITFDDAYLDILTNAKPLLDKFNYPFTIFINPGIIGRNSRHYLTWSQLKALSDDDVIIANHGFEHNSLARIPEGITQENWIKQQGAFINKAEQMIKEKTGQHWKYFAYPYGEYTMATETWLQDNGYIAFGQQSGAVGLSTNLTSIPRFPASKPYDKLISLKDKLTSLPFNLVPIETTKTAIHTSASLTAATFENNNDDYHKNQLSCYLSGQGKQTITWLTKRRFTMEFEQPLSAGRVRINCTAPSIKQSGRYYWYSKAWMILTEEGQWYPL